jgi:hypothetical protein
MFYEVTLLCARHVTVGRDASHEPRNMFLACHSAQIHAQLELVRYAVVLHKGVWPYLKQEVHAMRIAPRIAASHCASAVTS